MLVMGRNDKAPKGRNMPPPSAVPGAPDLSAAKP